MRSNSPKGTLEREQFECWQAKAAIQGALGTIGQAVARLEESLMRLEDSQGPPAPAGVSSEGEGEGEKAKCQHEWVEVIPAGVTIGPNGVQQCKHCPTLMVGQK